MCRAWDSLQRLSHSVNFRPMMSEILNDMTTVSWTDTLRTKGMLRKAQDAIQVHLADVRQLLTQTVAVVQGDVWKMILWRSQSQGIEKEVGRFGGVTVCSGCLRISLRHVVCLAWLTDCVNGFVSFGRSVSPRSQQRYRGSSPSPRKRERTRSRTRSRSPKRRSRRRQWVG